MQKRESQKTKEATVRLSYPISFADALIAAYVYLENASLVHKDPEYLTLEKEIDLIILPLKNKVAGSSNHHRSLYWSRKYMQQKNK